jgi:hypothetical protein
MRSAVRSIAVVTACLTLLTAVPAIAGAQRRGARVVRRPVVRSTVFIGGFYYPRYGFYDPWFQYPFGPYGYGPYGYGPYGYPIVDNTSSLRLDVKPRDAQVLVDGYSAGVVDDFDGLFQRLRLRPGRHELVFYLQGYRTIRQNLYVNPGSDKKISATMEPLAPGEASEPPPPPAEPADTIDDSGRAPRMPMAPDDAPRGPREPREPHREAPAEFGTLVIQVQPADAELLIDGERWTGSSSQDRTVIQLAAGRHHVEIRKSGFVTYAEDVLIRTGRTLPLNVRLPESGGPEGPPLRCGQRART